MYIYTYNISLTGVFQYLFDFKTSFCCSYIDIERVGGKLQEFEPGLYAASEQTHHGKNNIVCVICKIFQNLNYDAIKTIESLLPFF